MKLSKKDFKTILASLNNFKKLKSISEGEQIEILKLIFEKSKDLVPFDDNTISISVLDGVVINVDNLFQNQKYAIIENDDYEDHNNDVVKIKIEGGVVYEVCNLYKSQSYIIYDLNEIDELI